MSSTEQAPDSAAQTAVERAQQRKDVIAKECAAIFKHSAYDAERCSDYGGEIITLQTPTPWMTRPDGSRVQIVQIQNRDERGILDILLRKPETYQDPHKFEIKTDPTATVPYCTIWIKNEGAVTHFEQDTRIEDGGEIVRDRELLETVKQVRTALQLGEFILPPSTELEV